MSGGRAARIVGGAVARSVALVAIVALAATAVACRRDRGTTGSADNPFGLIVSAAHATAADAQALEQELARRSGLTVRVRVHPTGAAAVKAAGMTTTDAGILPLFEYLLAHQELGVRAGLQLVRQSGREFAGVLLVREDAPFQTLADLRGRKVAYVDGTSTTGYLLPASALARAGVEVAAHLAGSHDAAVAALRDGTVDAAATFAAPRPGLRALAPTGTVPNEPVFFAARVQPAARARVEAALVELAATAEGQALLGRIAGITGFAPIDDEAYRAVHDLLRETDRSVADLVPGGRHLIEWRRVPASELGPL